MTAILFDMFGVIAGVQSAESQAELKRLAGVSGEQFWDAYWSLRPLCDRGEIRATDHWHKVGERLDASFDADQVQQLIRRFSVLGLSCRIGAAKPEPAAYEWCRQRLMLPAGDILFVDDRADNVRAAQEFGMRGHVFTDLDTFAAALRNGCVE